jgi:hypothetical protein
LDLQSKIKTSVPYTIPELYTSIAELVTQKIKESEERMMSWISEEIGKIAPEKREKDLDERRASSHKAVDDMVSNITRKGFQAYSKTVYVIFKHYSIV